VSGAENKVERAENRVERSGVWSRCGRKWWSGSGAGGRSFFAAHAALTCSGRECCKTTQNVLSDSVQIC